MLFHFIGNGSAQHPALANGIGPLINQEFRIVFQRAVVHSIRVEGLGIPQCRFIKYTLGSIQEAYTQILSGSHDYKMGAILSADQAGGSLSFADPKDDLHMEHRPVFICPDHASPSIPAYSPNRSAAS